MPAVSKAQRRLFGMVKAVQSGEIDPSTVSSKVNQLAKKLDKKTVSDFAKSEEKGLPYKKESLRQIAPVLKEVCRRRK